MECKTSAGENKNNMAQLFQWSVPCIICEKPVEYHCNTCGDVLCPKCKKNHLKSNATKNHEIVPYSEGVTPNQTKECGTHPGHQCGYWCTTCDKPVCGDCMAFGSHKGHDFLKYEDKVKENKKRVQKVFGSYLALQAQWEDSLKELRQRKSDHEKGVLDLEKEIKQQADRMCTEVRRTEEKKTKNLQEARELSLGAFLRQEQRLMNGIETIKHYVKETEDALRLNDIASLPDPSAIEQRVRDTKLPQLKTRPEWMFLSGSLSNVGLIFGDVISLFESPTVESILSFELDPMKGVPALACIGSVAWIRGSEREVQLVDKKGRIKKKITLNFWMHDISVTKDQLLLIPDHNNRCIWFCSNNESLELLFTTDSGPCSLCPMENEDILVSFRYDRRVVQYTKEGNIRKEFDRALIRFPFYLAQNKANEDIYICNKSQNSIYSGGEILACDKNGKMKYRFTGGNDFVPMKICTELAGYVFIADHGTNRVHLLDKNGNFQRYLLNENHGLVQPRTIDSCAGYIWVSSGGKKTEVKVFKYREV